MSSKIIMNAWTTVFALLVVVCWHAFSYYFRSNPKLIWKNKNSKIRLSKPNYSQK